MKRFISTALSLWFVVHIYIQTGRASWYGHRFDGHKTASGELYNANKLTAASRSFSLGSMVLVRNVSNDRSVIVRINDYGPYVHRCIIDLSRAAAVDLGILHRGTARVRVERL